MLEAAPSQPSADDASRHPTAAQLRAVVTFCDRYYPSLYRFAFWHTQDRRAACEVATEALCRRLRERPPGDPVSTDETLARLLKKCRGLLPGRFRTLYRALRPSPRAKAPGCLRVLPGGAVGQAPVAACLARLSEPDRTIVLLAFEKDLSRRDIATLMGMRVADAVTAQLLRAMNRLLARMRKQGAAPPPVAHDGDDGSEPSEQCELL
jgi:DNA-directed RNA polymerase specialized sigma24 family protein